MNIGCFRDTKSAFSRAENKGSENASLMIHSDRMLGQRVIGSYFRYEKHPDQDVPIRNHFHSILQIKHSKAIMFFNRICLSKL